MDLHAIPAAKLRDYLKHGRISEEEFIAEIEQREDEQIETQQPELAESL